MRRLLTNPRRWFRFSLRALLLLCLVFGVWLGLEVRRAKRQVQVVRLVAAAGGSTEYAHCFDSAGKRIAQPELPGPTWLRNFIGDHYFLRLNGIYLTNVTNDDLRLFSGCKSIRRFAANDIDDEGAALLAQLKNLESIDIETTSLTDKGLRQLAALSKLRTLSISGARVTDQGLSCLEKLKDLQVLGVSDTQVTAHGVSRLKNRLPKLQVYFGGELPSAVDEKPLMAKLIKSGARFRADANGRITEIQFIGSPATDADLLIAVGLPSLTTARVAGARITPSGVAEFRRMRPDVEVIPALDSIHPDEIAAVNDLCRIGAKIGLRADGHVDSVELFDELTEQPITDASLDALRRLSKLQHLTTTSKDITDEGVRTLSDVQSLKSISLWGAQITDRGFASLGKMRNLQSIRLQGAQMTDQALVQLSAMPVLKNLSLRNTRITGSGLGSLAGLPELTELDLSDSLVDDAGLKDLQKLKRVQTLRLSCTDITDASLVSIAKLPLLERLSVNSTAITDAGLQRLSSASRLKHLNVSNTRVTTAGVANLSKALPKCRIKE